MCSPQARYAFPMAKVFQEENETWIERANPDQVQECTKMQDWNGGMIW